MKTLRLSHILSVLLVICSNIYAGDKTSFLKRQYTTNNGYKLNYRILYPENYEPEKKYPVILFLHGAGERGSDNEAQLIHGGDMFSAYTNRIAYPAFVIAPQCPENEYWVDYKRPKDGEERNYPTNPPVSKSLSAAKELIDNYISKGMIDTKQIHIAGLSMGGMGTFDLLCRYPNFFASATPICGAVNSDRIAHYKGKTAIRLYHGDNDMVVDVKYSRNAYNALKKTGANVIYTEYPGVGHDSWNNAFAEPDFLSWMFQK